MSTDPSPYESAFTEKASMAQLPPSPELKSSKKVPAMPDLSLENKQSTEPISKSRRLRSVARYQAFHPQALACSDTLTSSLGSLNEGEQANTVSSTSLSSNSLINNQPLRGTSADHITSLGAVAGPQGVALFRMSAPHIPLLILSHATNSKSKTSNISGLAFQPNAGFTTSPSLYLAATRGFSVLVWDASGHSAMPLRGRIGADAASTDLMDTSRITSMCWKPSSRLATGTSPLLATATSNSISLWDLRTAPQGSASTVHSFKPTLRFGASRKMSSFSNSSTSVPSLVQVACSSDSDECATIDAAGIVRIYDVRMTERTRASSNLGSAIATFCAHETAGVGISYFQSMKANDDAYSTSSWLTWGLDSPKASAVAKFWSWTNDSRSAAQQASLDSDDYWYMGNAPQSTSPYNLRAQLVRPNLACARVCASPVENSFMAVGHLPYDTKNEENQGGWWAELCSLDSNDSLSKGDERVSPTTFGLKSVVNFQGGGTSNHNWDEKALLSALGGRTDLGRLQAAELAFSGVSHRNELFPSATDMDQKSIGDDEKESSVELLLCCLSDTSVITTHVVPEAMPKASSLRSSDFSKREQSPIRPNRRMVRTAFPASHQPRVYPEDKEGSSLADAAGFWTTLGGETPQNHAEQLQTFADEKLSPQKKKSIEDPDIGEPPMTGSSNLQKNAGGIMPFDMEVPVAYGSVATNKVAITDISSGAVVSSNGMGVADEGAPVSVEVRETTPILENIESERVPCPRLCGATFGGGNGGLVMFHNGEIKKMWNWYQRTDTMRLSVIPNLKVDNTSSDSEGFDALSPQVAQTEENRTVTSSSGPRTLKELANMMATAKEAQWGERDGSDGSGSDSELSAGDNFFEEESLDSNSSDSTEEGGTGLVSASSRDQVYNRYFGSRAWKGTIEKVEGGGSHQRRNSELSASREIVPTYTGPSYEMLAPVVSVTHDHDPVILNHQSIALARGWELGAWENPLSPQNSQSTMVHNDKSNLGEIPLDSANMDFVLGQGLPHYRYLAQSNTATSKKGNMLRTKSDPNIGLNLMGARSRTPLDEYSVHGGEDSQRPNRQESVTFLKKLFSHQQEGGSGSFPNMLSPPDNPLDWQRTSSTGYLQLQGKYSSSLKDPAEDPLSASTNRNFELGVFTILRPQRGEKDTAFEVLKNIQEICLRNAKVCQTVGEEEKKGVWNLLAQTVEGQMDAEETGLGSALSVDLVSNLLKYYEALGDCQFLATIVCVLSGGSRNMSQPGIPKLLPQGQEEKYDSYIRRYAELLYAWGLLSTRAELNKHLLRIPPRLEGDFPAEVESTHLLRIPSRQEGDLSVEETSDKGRSPGVAVVFHCPRCGWDADFNTNVCRNCQDFAFRCSICDNAVRGLFTVCAICNHGGHVEHMKMWFSDNVQCPTGCGCNCSFVPTMPGSPTKVVVPVQ